MTYPESGFLNTFILRKVEQKSKCHGASNKVVTAKGLEDVFDESVEILQEGVEDDETASRRNEEDQRTCNLNYFPEYVHWYCVILWRVEVEGCAIWN